MVRLLGGQLPPAAVDSGRATADARRTAGRGNL